MGDDHEDRDVRAPDDDRPHPSGDWIRRYAPPRESPPPRNGTSRPSGSRTSGEQPGGDGWLDAWIARYLPAARGPEPWPGAPDGVGRRWILPVCPWDETHARGEAVITETAGGRPGASCRHDSCTWGWTDLRARLEPGYAARSRVEVRHGTELGNAQVLARDHGDRLRYVPAWGRWLTWDGRRWCRDELGAELGAAKEVVADLYAHAAELSRAAAAGDEEAGARAAAAAKWARTSSKASAIRAMVALAQSEAPIAAAPSAFDGDPFALNVENGTIDLRTGALRSHQPADLITQLAPVAYDPAAPAPRWERFLARVLPDPDLRAWVQRYAGYALTGDVREQVLAFAFGAGANGKSVLLDVLLGVLGDYGLRAAPDLVLAKHGEAHPTELADLEGRRLVVVSEIEQGRAWAESTIKRITGDTTITARRMRQDFYTFAATHKIIVAANTQPKVRGTDHAIWRRMRLVPFEVTIPEEERDRELVATLLAEEAPGILAWLVRGCLTWERDGLGSAGAIDAATSAYRDDQDVLGHWIADECVLHAATWTAMASLYDSYRRWCEATGREPWTRETVRARLLERPGITESRRQHGRVRGLAGIGLRVTSGDGGDGEREVDRGVR